MGETFKPQSTETQEYAESHEPNLARIREVWSQGEGGAIASEEMGSPHAGPDIDLLRERAQAEGLISARNEVEEAFSAAEDKGAAPDLNALRDQFNSNNA